MKCNSADMVGIRIAVTAATKLEIKETSSFVEKFTSTLDLQQSVADKFNQKFQQKRNYKKPTALRKKLLVNGTWNFELGLEGGK